MIERIYQALCLGIAGSCLACVLTPPAPLEPPAQAARPAPSPPTLRPRTTLQPSQAMRPASVRLLEESRYSLNVQDADLKGLLLGLGTEGPFNIVVEPGVSGSVTADLANVSLGEILDQLVRPHGYAYQVRGNVVRIFPGERQSRTYRVDYPNYQRSGTSDLIVSGAIGSAPEIGEASSGDNADTSTSGIQTSQVLDFWTELEDGLRSILGINSEGEGSSEREEGSEGVPLAARRVVVARQSGLVTVTAEPQQLLEVEAYLEEVTRAIQRQVLIDVRILEIDIGDDLDFGVDWEAAPNFGSDTQGAFTRSILPGLRDAVFTQDLAPLLTSGGFMFGIAAKEIGVVVSALSAQRDVRVVSTPRLATLNNHKGIIKVVRNQVFFIAETETSIVEGAGGEVTVEFVPQIIPVGVTLDVTPQISEAGQITLHIHPSISEVVDIVEQPRGDAAIPDVGSLPVIDLRETDTVMRIDDGDTVVIGGLIQSRELEVHRKVPLLGEIPWLGQLFRRSEIEEKRTELVILVSPQVLDAPRIARVRSDAEASIGRMNDLRAQRQHEDPWWRKPFGTRYDEFDHAE